MGFFEPLSFFAIVAVPVYFYFKIKQAYARKLPISSIFLWKKVYDIPDRSKFRRNWMINLGLILQLLGLLLAVFASAYPYFMKTRPAPAHITIVMDNSIISSARTGNSTVLKTLVNECLKLLDTLQPDDKIGIIANSAGVTPGQEFFVNKTPSQASDIIKNIIVSETPAPLDELILSAQTFKAGQKTDCVFVFTSQQTEKYAATDLIMITVPPDTNNIGITDCSMSRQKDNTYTLFAGCKNYSAVQMTARTVLKIRNLQTAEKSVVFGPATVTPLTFPDLNIAKNAEVSLEIEINDSITCDNSVTLLPGIKNAHDICIIGADAKYLQKAFDSMPDVNIHTSQSMPAPATLTSLDMLVFYRVIPDEFPESIPCMVIDPPKNFYPFSFGAKKTGNLVMYSSDIELLQGTGLESEKITFKKYLDVDVNASEAANVTEIARADTHPLILYYEKGLSRILLMAFDPEWRPDNWETDWASYKASFPVFWAKMTEKILTVQPWEAYSSFKTGSPVILPHENSAQITDPEGIKYDIKPGRHGILSFVPNRTGIYDINCPETGRKYRISAGLLDANAVPKTTADSLKQFDLKSLSGMREQLQKTPKPVMTPLILISIIMLLMGWYFEKKS